jgi:hypothetical protein
MRIMPLLLALAAASSPAVAAERRYSVTDFDRIQIEGPYEVTLATGSSSSARASGDAGGLERVAIDVQGRTLRIRPDRSGWGGYPGDPAGIVRIALTTRALRAATLVGAGSLAIDRARGLKVELSVSGSGTIALAAADADALVVGLLGSGTVSVGGKARQLRATVQGSGDFDGARLRVEDADITAATSGDIATGAARTAKVAALGRGRVEIVGAPSCTITGPSAAQVACGR